MADIAASDSEAEGIAELQLESFPEDSAEGVKAVPDLFQIYYTAMYHSAAYWGL